MRCWLLLFCCFLSRGIYCQQPDPSNREEEIQEALIFRNPDLTALSASGQEEISVSSINLNDADGNELGSIPLSPMQISALISYRILLGPLVDIHELQSIPGWNAETIRRILPFVYVALPNDPARTIRDRLRRCDHSLLASSSFETIRGSGATEDSSSLKAANPESPLRLMLRLRGSNGNLLQYGLLGEKDAGEPLFMRGRQKGFDFYAAHFFLRQLGSIKALALGDYKVCLGQGLISWQGFSVVKGADVIMIKRQSSVLQPHRSAGEQGFFRGAGATWQFHGLEATAFFSIRKLDAHAKRDSITGKLQYVTYLQRSGLHRTESEYLDKGVLSQTTIGFCLRKETGGWKGGLNGMWNRQSLPLIPAGGVHNIFASVGENTGNVSLDLSYSWRNMHFFGEWAINERRAPAIIQGVMASIGSRADLSILYRNISPRYHAFQSACFSENSSTTDEHGLYAGIFLRPGKRWEVKAFADFFNSPWPGFRMSSPEYGKEFLFQVRNQPQKKIEMLWTFRNKSQLVSGTSSGNSLFPVLHESREQILFEMRNEIIRNTHIALRFIWTSIDQGLGMISQGRCISMRIKYSNPRLHISTGASIHFFETDNYSARLYIIDNESIGEVLVSAVYGLGHKAGMHFSYDFRHWGVRILFTRQIQEETQKETYFSGYPRTFEKCCLAGQLSMRF